MSYALCPSGPCGPVKLTSLAFECLGVQWGKFKALLPLWWGVYFSSLQYLEANWVCVMGSAEVWGAIPGARLRESQCVPGRRAPAAPCRGPAALPHRWQELPVCSTATSGAHAELLTVRCLACPLFGSMFLFPFLTWFFLVSVILLLYASCSFQNPWAIFIVKFITNSIWNECKFPKSGTSAYCFLDFPFLLRMELPVTRGFLYFNFAELIMEYLFFPCTIFC